MPRFNLAELKRSGTSSSSQDYGFLVDQLEIKENQLASDGNLSPGDYKLLASEAQKLYGHPGLTPAQRSNLQVKYSSYLKGGSVKAISEGNDISRLNREVEDDQATINLRFSNDPAKYLEAQADVQVAKINRLSESIDSLDAAGDDTTNHVNELNSTLAEYSDTLQALEDVNSYQPGQAPTSGYAAYVVTNSHGEVTSLKVKRVGSESGYIETNGVYGGLPLYGKVNHKEYGKNVFVLGGKQFSAADTVIPGPDGTMKPTTLISTDMQKNGKGAYTVAQSGYTDVDLGTVRPQSSVRAGAWIQGDKGFLYQMQEDGRYKKFVNADKEKLGIKDNDIIRMPKSFEQGILNNVSETVDGSIAPITPQPDTLSGPANIPSPDAGTDANQQTGFANSRLGRAAMNAAGVISPLIPAAANALGGKGRPNTGGAPTERAPSTAGGIANKAVSAVKGFFGNLFGN